jgi:alkylated DNA repair dioxygenase AlkB
VSDAHRRPLRAPEGFRYAPEFVSEAEERALLTAIGSLDLGAVRMRGQVARRRTAHFGWVYGYESARIAPGPPIPDFLRAVQGRAARLMGVRPRDLAEVLITEYPAGAGIGWHLDARMFGDVAGVSLLGDCRFRFERGAGAARETREVAVAARSAYVLAGDARWGWRHAIPPGRAPRCSITFRTLVKIPDPSPGRRYNVADPVRRLEVRPDTRTSSVRAQPGGNRPPLLPPPSLLLPRPPAPPGRPRHR